MKRAAQVLLLFSVIFVVSGSSALAQDGKTLYRIKFCVVCHGPSGLSVDPNYPTLASQNQLYLINQLKDILAKKRAGKFTLFMTEHPVVNHITADEISAIAEFLHGKRLSGGAGRGK